MATSSPPDGASRPRRTPTPSLAAYRGPNHVLITRRSSRAAFRARTRKLLNSGKWPAVFLHGLGAALVPAVQLAAELVQEEDGRLVASCTTSTVALIDHRGHEDDLLLLGDEDSSSTLRHNSAVHIRLSRRHSNDAAAATSRTQTLTAQQVSSATASPAAATSIQGSAQDNNGPRKRKRKNA